MRHLILTALIILSNSLSASENSTSEINERHIIWAYTDYPPGYITKGPQKGQGFVDKITEFVIDQLTEFKHSRITYPSIARLQRQIQHSKEKTICNSALFYRDKEERKLMAGRQVYSAPNFVFFLPDIIVKKSKRHLYKEIESYEELLNNENLLYGFTHTTGPITSTILGKYLGFNFDISTMDVRERLSALSEKKNIVIRQGPDNKSGPLLMIIRDRLDYILDYEFSVKYQAERLGLSEKFEAIPVKETLNLVSMAAFSCSDTTLGKEVIQSINKILINSRGTKQYKEILAPLLPSSKKRQAKFWAEYNKMLQITE